MTDFLENFDLSGDSLDVFLIIDLFLLKNFDGNLSNKQAKERETIHNAHAGMLEQQMRSSRLGKLLLASLKRTCIRNCK